MCRSDCLIPFGISKNGERYQREIFPPHLSAFPSQGSCIQGNSRLSQGGICKGSLSPLSHIPDYIARLLMFVQCDIVPAEGAEIPLG